MSLEEVRRERPVVFVIDREGVVRAQRVEASPVDTPEVEDVLYNLLEKAL